MQRVTQEQRSNRPPVSTLLPPDVRNALVYASTLPDAIRLIHIERITSEARARYPKLFHPDRAGQ
jgi:hypothetical protein